MDVHTPRGSKRKRAELVHVVAQSHSGSLENDMVDWQPPSNTNERQKPRATTMSPQLSDRPYIWIEPGSVSAESDNAPTAVSESTADNVDPAEAHIPAHLFIPAHVVPLSAETRRLFTKLFSPFGEPDVRLQPRGYDVLFPDTEKGRSNLGQCYLAYNSKNVKTRDNPWEKRMLKIQWIHSGYGQALSRNADVVMEDTEPSNSIEAKSTSRQIAEMHQAGSVHESAHQITSVGRLHERPWTGNTNYSDASAGAPASIFPLHMKPTISISNDDNISLQSGHPPSEMSSSSSASRSRKPCYICTKSSALDAETLVTCSECHRRYHRGCHKVVIPSTTETWKCYRCERQARQSLQSTGDDRLTITLSSSSPTTVKVLDGRKSRSGRVLGKQPERSKAGSTAPVPREEVSTAPRPSLKLTFRRSLNANDAAAGVSRVATPVRPPANGDREIPETPDDQQGSILLEQSEIATLVTEPVAISPARVQNASNDVIDAHSPRAEPSLTLEERVGKASSWRHKLLILESAKEDELQKVLNDPTAKHARDAVKTTVLDLEETRLRHFNKRVLTTKDARHIHNLLTEHLMVKSAASVRSTPSRPPLENSASSVDVAAGAIDDRSPRLNCSTPPSLTIDIVQVCSITPESPQKPIMNIANGTSPNQVVETIDLDELPDADTVLPETNIEASTEFRSHQVAPPAQMWRGPDIVQHVINPVNSDGTNNRHEVRMVDAGTNTEAILEEMHARNSTQEAFDQAVLQNVRKQLKPVFTRHTPQYWKGQTPGPTLEEIKARPSRKKLFNAPLSQSRLGTADFDNRMRAIFSGLRRPDGDEGESRTIRRGDVDFPTQSSEDVEAEVESFDNLDDLLGVPKVCVPMMYEGQLVFREGAKSTTGRAARHKQVFRIGKEARREF